MNFKIPKDTKELAWTNHVVGKMRQYGLSEQKVRSVVYRHTRKEEGIAPRTIAVMQPSGSKKKPTEIWVMYQIVKIIPLKAGQKANLKNLNTHKKRIITAWRYPGTSPKRNPIPREIAEEIAALSEK